MVWNPNTMRFESPTIQGSGFGSNWANNNLNQDYTNNLNQDYTYDLNQDFDFGMNMGTLKLGTAALGAWNGWQANKAAKERNAIARDELAQNAKSFDINTGLQLATMQAEEARRNAYAGGFLADNQRSDRFKDYDLQKLSVAR